ncbi:MAG: UDP-4-amino-4,6-dideoxy-N-acetyl-beta-L-altrosamine transaminase [Candidatus Vogelbacteria bacterium]|nr:UDP-4-amino-4,6-dideoxy-N-acetyl-beta-L-altrosamine transaminase [Candidatus Vogelbacteria bacterium]
MARSQVLKRIPYATQWIEDDDLAAVVAALKSSNLTQGPIVAEFEKQVAQYCGAKYAIAVNSGTSALHIACLAAGISVGDEVVTSPITFVASANCVLYCGGRPVFADVDPATINIDPSEIEKKISPKTKAIIPVHFTGNPCDLESIYNLAKKHNLTVIEDAAHALGAEYQGEKIGACQYSDMAILSFHPVKHITTGEGGMVLTNNEALREKLIFFRSHGITRDPKYMKKQNEDWYYEMHYLGHNYRLTDIQSALGISQLQKIDKFVARRREIAQVYNRAFLDIEGIDFLKESQSAKSAYHLYVILVKKRKNFYNKLRAAGLIVNVHYIPVYLQPYYQRMGYKAGDCPNAEEYYAQAITIPLYPKMAKPRITRVIKAVKEALN